MKDVLNQRDECQHCVDFDRVGTCLNFRNVAFSLDDMGGVEGTNSFMPTTPTTAACDFLARPKPPEKLEDVTCDLFA
jgi:hypothetical protein